MEDDGQDGLLVVDEKETCVAQFVPEDKFEHIWNQESYKNAEKSLSEENFDKSTVEPSEKGGRKSTKSGCQLNCGGETFYEGEIVEAPKKKDAVVFEQIEKRGEICKGCFGDVYENVSSTAAVLTDWLMKIVGNRWAWNICVILAKISFAVFLYLVIAVSTGIIAIIFNIHDAYVQLKIEENQVCNNPKRQENVENKCMEHNTTNGNAVPT